MLCLYGDSGASPHSNALKLAFEIAVRRIEKLHAENYYLCADQDVLWVRNQWFNDTMPDKYKVIGYSPVSEKLYTADGKLFAFYNDGCVIFDSYFIGGDQLKQLKIGLMGLGVSAALNNRIAMRACKAPPSNHA